MDTEGITEKAHLQMMKAESFDAQNRYSTGVGSAHGTARKNGGSRFDGGQYDCPMEMPNAQHPLNEFSRY